MTDTYADAHSDVAATQPRPVAHPNQAKGSRIFRLLDSYAPAVVVHDQSHRRRVGAQA